ncbi:hypothetical protein, partial [Staphylococcus aureus]|uniref:hypothetical protein n=1 Tax=Staphylococcus aureus TaxID=1280 RepID=UPI001C9E5304
ISCVTPIITILLIKRETVISMPDLIEMLVLKVITSWRGPKTEADRKSAYNKVQVGGAQT